MQIFHRYANRASGNPPSYGCSEYRMVFDLPKFQFWCFKLNVSQAQIAKFVIRDILSLSGDLGAEMVIRRLKYVKAVR